MRFFLQPCVLVALLLLPWPLLAAHGAGAASRQSLGTAVFGGMIGSTVLGLIFTPALYVTVTGTTEWVERLLELAEQNQKGSSAPAPETESTASDENVYRLPPSLTSMLGRVKESASLTKSLLQEDVRILTIVGPPGVGKTRLALYVAEGLADEFKHGAVFVNLAPVQQPEMVFRWNTFVERIGTDCY